MLNQGMPPLTAAKHMHQHYQLQIASKTNQNSSTLDKKYGPKAAALRLNDSGM